MPKRKKYKILIIKLGYSETLGPVIRHTCSLGDVFRTTAVLHLFKNDHVTWLTDPAAVPLLQGNPHIARLLEFNLMSVLQLLSERFDKVINLEKVPGICALGDRIAAWSRYGFRLDPDTGDAEAYEKAYDALAVATQEDVARLYDRSWLEGLFDMLGAEWKGEAYILGYEPTSRVRYDLGFNTHVGSLLPLKAWPLTRWRALGRLAGRQYSVTWQQHLDDLRGYMEWIHSCRMLVTGDSLGLFLGLAMGKRVLALFGPTSPGQHGPHERLRTLTPEIKRDCLPCFKAGCVYPDPCMGHIAPRQVMDAIEAWGVA